MIDACHTKTVTTGTKGHTLWVASSFLRVDKRSVRTFAGEGPFALRKLRQFENEGIGKMRVIPLDPPLNSSWIEEITSACEPTQVCQEKPLERERLAHCSPKNHTFRLASDICVPQAGEVDRHSCKAGDFLVEGDSWNCDPEILHSVKKRFGM